MEIQTMPTPQEVQQGTSQEEIGQHLEMEPHSNLGRKIFLIIFSVILGVAIIGGGIWGALKIYEKLAPSPEEMVFKVLDNMAQSGSFAFDGNIYTNIEQSGDVTSSKVNLEFDLNISGAYDFFNPDNAKSYNDLRFKTNFLLNQDFIFNLQTRYIDNTVYILAKELPSFPLLPLDNLVNQWVRLDIDNQETSSLVNINYQDYQDELVKNQEQLKSALIQTRPLILLDSGSGGEIAGVNTNYYRIGYDVDNLKEFITVIFDLYQQDESTKVAYLKDFDDYFQENETFLKQFYIDVWVGKDDGLLYRLFTENKGFYVSSGDAVALDTKIEINFSDYGQPVDVARPENYLSLKEVMSGILNVDPNVGPVETVKFSDTDSDGDGLRDIDEMHYNSDPNNPDTDGDGYNDGDEVNNCYDPTGPGKLTSCTHTIIE